MKPLTGTNKKGEPYVRPKEVEAEIAAALEWPLEKTYALALEGKLRPQTLVYLIRNFRPNRSTPEHDRLILAFFSRLQRSGQRMIQNMSELDRERVDELVRDKALDLFSSDDLDIFEMSFKLGAERLYLTATAKVRLRSKTEVSREDMIVSDSGWTGEETADVLSHVSDGSMPLAEAKAMLADVMELLNENERLAVHYVHELGLTEKEAAEQLNCSDRNIRYLISNAREKALGQGKGARKPRVNRVKP